MRFDGDRLASRLWLVGGTLAWTFVSLGAGLGGLTNYAMAYVRGFAPLTFRVWPGGNVNWFFTAIVAAAVTAALAYALTRWLRAPGTIWIAVLLGSLLAWIFVLAYPWGAWGPVIGLWGTTDLLVGLVCVVAAYGGGAYGASASEHG